MNKIDRIYELLEILKRSRHPVSAASLCDQLECSQATLKRTLNKVRVEFKGLGKK